jgi:hypothetical protein
MAKKIEGLEIEVKEEVKQEGFKAYADFEFLNRAYKVGDLFVPPVGIYPDPNMDEFRRTNNKKNIAKGHAFYFEIPPKTKDGEIEVRRVVLPVE